MSTPEENPRPTPVDVPLIQIGAPAPSAGGCGDACGCGGDDDYELDPLECGLDPDLAQLLADAGLDPVQVEDIAHVAIEEDLDHGVDVTTVATVSEEAMATGDFTAREAGVVAGLRVAEAVLSIVCTAEFEVERHVEDGDRVVPGQKLLTVTTRTRDLLTGERSALNLLCRLSGIATATRAWADVLEGTKAKVRDTRKTTPGLRALEKYAVRCGGGVNHRMSLSDAALVKDNHVIAAGGVAEAFKRVRDEFPDVPIEVEVDTLEQVHEVLAAGADLILLDNFTPAETEEAVAVVGGRAALESSGRLTRQRPRLRRRGRRLPRRRCAHPLLTDPRHRPGLPRRGRRLMLLTIDVGNTHTVLGLFDGEEIVEHWRISTDARRTADELAVLLNGLMGMHPLLGEELGDGIEGIAICATVPAVLHELREVTRRYYGDVPAVLVEPGIKTGVPILVDNPKEVGADRIINSVAAVELYGGPAIVVDFGTATTFDAVSARGEYAGGVIAPGIEISVEALGVKGAQLRKIELARPRSVIGKNTVEAMQAGIVYGFAGQVDGVVERMKKELAADPDDVTVIATGGLAPMVLGESSVIDEHEPWLTLIGLRLVYERNVARM